MATDKLKKENAKLAQPPSSNKDGGESAYTPLEQKGRYSKSYEESGHMQSAERPAAPGGILKDQPGEYGRNYPGRPLPPTQPVTQATEQTGVTKKCADTQNDANRHELNSDVAVKGY